MEGVQGQQLQGSQNDPTGNHALLMGTESTKLTVSTQSTIRIIIETFIYSCRLKKKISWEMMAG